MAIANGTCVSLCNQPKAQFGYIRRVTPVCRCLHPFCRWRNLVTSRESKAHFGLPWVRPSGNRGKCHTGGKRVQCLSNACSMYPSIFNRFPVIKPVSSNVRHFITYFAHFGLPWVRPWDNCGKCYMDRKNSMLVKRIAACTHLSSTVYEL